jgi:hypothetical protein
MTEKRESASRSYFAALTSKTGTVARWRTCVIVLP